ncbi:MAG: hypothetical protein APR53_07830 [Methanoculleus sp. SDB]|nr:MAG: hypothetical protein APR53_07830 [Methanoculleus sp. SDB]
MDEIEQGFSAIVEKIEKLKKDGTALAADVKKNDAALLGRMAEIASPLIPEIGLSMLVRGKQDGKGEIYDAEYMSEKMIMLGKTDPIDFRPDDPKKRVESQYCILSEKGKFFELMYSSDNFIIDSYLGPLSTEDVLELYGYDVMYLLYRALHDFLKKQDELVKALEITLEFVFNQPENR